MAVQPEPHEPAGVRVRQIDLSEDLERLGCRSAGVRNQPVDDLEPVNVGRVLLGPGERVDRGRTQLARDR